MVLLLVALCYSLIMSQFAAPQQISLLGCPSTCGKLRIPYPFGIGRSCARQGFNLNCNRSTTPPKVYLGDDSTVELLNISLLDGQATVRYYRMSDCYSRNETKLDNGYSFAGTGDDSPYTFSNLRNKFTVIGCDTYAYIYAYNSSEFTGGCVTVCDRLEKLVNGSCFGLGCCQTAIPKGLKYYEVQVNSYDNHTKVWDFNPCSYAFLVDQEWFTFNVEDITGKSKYNSTVEQVPVVLDWVAGNESCVEASRDKNKFACRSDHSECYNSTSGAIGYICNCSSGYEGNPYLDGGCHDVDECQRTELYPCNGTCLNTQGGYTCTCPKGSHGDPNTYGCIKEKKITLGISIGISCGLALLLIMLCVRIIRRRLLKRRIERKRERYFKENYDILVQRQSLCNTNDNLAERIKFFTLKDLEKATNKFDKSRIVGVGGHGTIYKGLLELHVVAIKRSKANTKIEIEDFINEIILLSHIKHRNVVQFLGCCFETEVPLIVYEFISNGTLFDHLHYPNEEHQLSWDDRVRIATEISSALAYMHSEANVLVLHRDIKSSNVLLDERFRAKISDFGASRTIMFEQTHISTCVQGTLGYIDPEYMHTGQLTEKSDVYSLSVILVELTGKRASYRSIEDGGNLVSYFISASKGDNLAHVIDGLIAEDVSRVALETISDLAIASLSIRGKDRPTIKEMKQTLEGLKNGKGK